MITGKGIADNDEGVMMAETEIDMMAETEIVIGMEPLILGNIITVVAITILILVVITANMIIVAVSVTVIMTEKLTRWIQRKIGGILDQDQGRKAMRIKAKNLRNQNCRLRCRPTRLLKASRKRREMQILIMLRVNMNSFVVTVDVENCK